MVTESAAAALRSIERKLERWELQHLREHAAHLANQAEQLQAQLQMLQERLDYAESVADYWREQVLQLQGELADDVTIGLTVDGRMGVVSVAPELAPDRTQDGGEVVDSDAHGLAVDSPHPGTAAGVAAGLDGGQGLPLHGSAQSLETGSELGLEAVDLAEVDVAHRLLRMLDEVARRTDLARRAIQSSRNFDEREGTDARICVEDIASPLNAAVHILDAACERPGRAA